jgi:hypothetical protein
MKKQLLLLAFALNVPGDLVSMQAQGPLAGLMNSAPLARPAGQSYGLDAVVKRFQALLSGHEWVMLIRQFNGYDADGSSPSWYTQQLLTMNITDLNAIDPKSKKSLFQAFIDLTDNDFEAIKTILHQLIINGLSTKLKQDDQCLATALLEKRRERYEALVEDMKQYGFTLPLLAPATAKVPAKEPEKQQPSGSSPAHEEPIKKAALEGAGNQSNPEQGQKKIDKQDMLNVMRKIKMPAIYCSIGVAVLVAACIIYKKYAQKPVDAENDEEIDEDQQESQKA